MSIERALFILLAGTASIARAAPSPELCPAELRCSDARGKIAHYRRELTEMEARLDDKKNKDPIPDQAKIEAEIADLGNLAQCARCPKKMRSEADLVRGGIEGLLAKYYDSWGPKKGEDGKRSFRAIREATRVDPDNLAAWTLYGDALVSVSKETFKDRIAKYLSIDLKTELASTDTNLRRLLAKKPHNTGDAREALNGIQQAMK